MAAKDASTGKSGLGEALVLGLGLSLFGGLHLFEPSLGMTWSFAHLGRSQWLIVLAGILIVLVPIAMQRLWAMPSLNRTAEPLGRSTTVWCFLGLWSFLIVVGQLWPAPDVVPDAHFLPDLIQGGFRLHRYFLVSYLYGGLYVFVRDFISPHDFVRVLNAGFSAATFFFVFDAARTLVRNQIERFALVAIFWTAFGNVQLTLGYTDVYPAAQFFLVLYVWSCLRFFAGESRLELCVITAVLAPFAHPALIFLVPSLAVPALAAWRTPEGARTLARAVLLGVLTSLGMLFLEYGTFAEPGRILASKGWGKYTWKPNEFDLLRRFEEVFHGVLLVDGVGLVLALAAGLVGAWRRWGSPGWLFFILVVCQVAYAFRLKPVWGAFVDWDSISTLAVPMSFLGGYLLLLWGRARPRITGLLVGLAVAVSAVHLLARLNALDIDFQAHKQEAPLYHDKRAGRRHAADGAMERVIEERWKQQVAQRARLRDQRSRSLRLDQEED